MAAIRLHSRAHLFHPPNGLPTGVRLFLKRDDELGGLVANGSKLRKWASVLPFLQEKQFQHVVLCGGYKSNNVAAGTWLLREHGFNTYLLLREGNPSTTQSTNEMLWKLAMIGHENNVRFVQSVAALAIEAGRWRNELEQLHQTDRVFVVPEGTSCCEALSGAISLAHDIFEENCKSLNEYIHHIFVDAGTGFSSFALLVGLAELRVKWVHVHVVLLAEDEVAFIRRIDGWLHELRQRPATDVPQFVQTLSVSDLVQLLTLHAPTNARSFGSVNATVLNTIRQWAQLGVLLDPIYSAKLMYEMMRIIHANPSRFQGNVLAVHSGGTQATLGFAHQLLGFKKQANPI